MPMPKDPIKADETRKRMSDSQRKRWENPEEHAKTRKSNIAYFETHPEAKEKRSKDLIKFYSSVENREKSSEAQKKSYRENPERSINNSNGQKKRFENPEELKKLSERATKYFENPENRENMSKIKKQFYKDHPEKCEEISRNQIKNAVEHPERLEKTWAGSKKYWEDSANCERASETKKQYYIDNPDAGLNHSEKLIKFYNDHPEKREEASERQRKNWENVEYRQRLTKSLTEATNTPEYRKNRSMIAKKIMNDPENRKRNSELSLKRFEDPTERKKLSDGRIRKLLENSKYAIEYIVSYYGEEFLNGHPRIDFPKYCEIFEEVKPRVRAFFNYTCTKCGKHESENGRLLSTHHVFYVKEACCLSDQDGYWTNLNAIDHKEQDYFIGNNPNYFALLCTKCHGETGGNYERRKNNADGLKNLIDDKFGGRCYFSESEMVENGYIKLSRTEWKKI